MLNAFCIKGISLYIIIYNLNKLSLDSCSIDVIVSPIRDGNFQINSQRRNTASEFDETINGIKTASKLSGAKVKAWNDKRKSFFDARWQ